jgi:hypothetical protein
VEAARENLGGVGLAIQLPATARLPRPEPPLSSS